MTNEDLKTMQAWPLERKIRVSQLRIMEWYQHWGGKVYVSFSGGKDSTVLLDLARRVYPDIEAVFVDTGLEYPEVRKFALSKGNVKKLKPEMRFDEVIEKYGYPVVSKEVSEAVEEARKNILQGKSDTKRVRQLYGLEKIPGTDKPSPYNKTKWKFLLEAPFKISKKCCHVMKKQPMYDYERKTGKKPMIGTMAEESHLRKSHWIQSGCNAFEAKRPTSKPLSFWREQDILKYLKITGLDYCSVYGEIKEQAQETMEFVERKLYTTGCDRTGCMFCMFGAHLEKEPNRFQRMKITHPKQYDYCINKLGCGAVLDHIDVPY